MPELLSPESEHFRCALLPQRITKKTLHLMDLIDGLLIPGISTGSDGTRGTEAEVDETLLLMIVVVAAAASEGPPSSDQAANAVRPTTTTTATVWRTSSPRSATRRVMTRLIDRIEDEVVVVVEEEEHEHEEARCPSQPTSTAIRTPQVPTSGWRAAPAPFLDPVEYNVTVVRISHVYHSASHRW
ncbi:unnamed protein product [Heligmosomoides polygyrus]|uniref:Uncharacterized protein n=1 Tax=Heligmosomoides polygyrus TaxID=6339 RepID=A0A183FR49_HELPZ|nr:unnamed protein product [Heligmosomoides polygyrus]